MDGPYRVHAPLNFSSWLREPSYTPPPPPPSETTSLFSTRHLDHVPYPPKGGGAIYQFPREPFDLKHVSTSSAIRGVPPGNPLFLWIIPVIVKSGRIDNGKLGLGIFFLGGEGRRRRRRKLVPSIVVRTISGIMRRLSKDID